MGDYLSSPFTFNAEAIRVFASVPAGAAGEAVEAGIREAIEAAIRKGLVGSSKQIKKLLQSSEGVSLVMKKLTQAGWKEGDEITDSMLNAAVKDLDNLLTNGVKGVDNQITKELNESFAEGGLKGNAIRSATLKNIPEQSMKAADDIAQQLGLDASQTAGLRQLFKKSAYQTFNGSIKSYNRKWFTSALRQTITPRNIIVGGIIGGAGFLIWTGVTEGVAGIIRLLENVGILPEGSAEGWLNLATQFRLLVVGLGLACIGLITYKVTSALTPDGGDDDAEDE